MNNFVSGQGPYSQNGLQYPNLNAQRKVAPDVKLMYISSPGISAPSLSIRCRSDNEPERQAPTVQIQNVQRTERNKSDMGITVELSYAKQTSDAIIHQTAQELVYGSDSIINGQDAKFQNHGCITNSRKHQRLPQQNAGFVEPANWQTVPTNAFHSKPNFRPDGYGSDQNTIWEQKTTQYNCSVNNGQHGARSSSSISVYPESSLGLPPHYCNVPENSLSRYNSTPLLDDQSTSKNDDSTSYQRRIYSKMKYPMDRIRPARQRAPVHLLSFAVSIPHPDKIGSHGEDAHFVMNDAVGVFDGVGSWGKSGIDAGLYAKGLAKHISSHLTHYPNASVENAVNRAVKENHHLGSSTVCAVSVQNGVLSGVNVGDSGLILIRNGYHNPIYQSRKQNHKFNQPYQVSYKNNRDLRNAEMLFHQLVNGDLIIMGSDGLWDNLYLDEILQTVFSHMSRWNANEDLLDKNSATAAFSGYIRDHKIYENQTKYRHREIHLNLTELGLALAKQTCRIAHSSRAESPFSEHARINGLLHSGGKLDDITIIVSLVTNAPEWYRSYIETDCPICL